MDTPVKTTLQSVMSDPAVDTTLTMVATMVKLSRDAVTTIVASGLPFMATVADTDPVVFKAMYAQSVKYLPPPTRAFYTKLGKGAPARQALATDFQTMYGSMTGAITRDTANQSRTTEAQVVQVLAATMPAVVYAVGRANTRVNEVGFGRQLRNLQA
jgi:hypothetical protein